MSTNPIKQSPTATIGTIAASTLTLLAWLVAHDVISAGLARTYGPYAVLVAVAGFFFITYWHVSPWVKVQEAARALEDGRLPDADVARVLAGVADVVHGALGTSWLDQHLTGEAHPDTVEVGAPVGSVPPEESVAEVPEPVGMSAGAPDQPTLSE